MRANIEPGDSVRHPAEAARILAGLGWASLGVLIFAGWFVVTRMGLSHALRVWDIIALRFGVGALVLAPVLVRSRLPGAAWRRGFLFALLWGAPFVLCVALGLELTSARLAASVTPAMMPVFAGLFAFLFLRGKVGPTQLIGYLVIVLGLISLVLADWMAHGLSRPEGVLALALAAAMWAAYTLLFMRSGLTAFQSAAMICFWSATLYLPFYFGLGLGRIGSAGPGELTLQTGYQGILLSGVAIAVFNRAVSLLGPGASTAIIALIPVVASLLAVPALGEVPSAPESIAIIVLAAGVLLTARTGRILLPPSSAKETP